MNQGITLKDLLAFGSIGATIIAGAFFFGGLAARRDCAHAFGRAW